MHDLLSRILIRTIMNKTFVYPVDSIKMFLRLGSVEYTLLLVFILMYDALVQDLMYQERAPLFISIIVVYYFKNIPLKLWQYIQQNIE